MKNRSAVKTRLGGTEDGIKGLAALPLGLLPEGLIGE